TRSTRDWSSDVCSSDLYRALGVVRSLGRRRIPVWLINQGGHLVATASRYVRRRLPWPACDDHGKINFLLRLCASHNLNGWALIRSEERRVGKEGRSLSA